MGFVELPDDCELHGQIVRLILTAHRITSYPRLHASGKHACQGLARMVPGVKIWQDMKGYEKMWTVAQHGSTKSFRLAQMGSNSFLASLHPCLQCCIRTMLQSDFAQSSCCFFWFCERSKPPPASCALQLRCKRQKNPQILTSKLRFPEISCGKGKKALSLPEILLLSCLRLSLGVEMDAALAIPSYMAS